MSTFTTAVVCARRYIADHDPMMAVYVMRDLAETRDAGLDELAWAMSESGCTEKEAENLIALVEAREAK